MHTQINTAAKPEVDVTHAGWLQDFLKFVPNSGVGTLRQRFTLLVAERLGARIAAITRADGKAGTRLSSRLYDLPADSFMRILLAPESVHRLLWPELHQPSDIAEFFQRAVEAERSLCGLDFSLDPPGWTALGDEWCGDGAQVAVLKITDFPPLVLGDPSKRQPLAAHPHEGGDDQLPPTSLKVVKARLTEVRDRLKATDELFWTFARDFNTTLVLRRSGGEQSGFRSSSPERYVGRSILWNPDLSDVTLADLAEALIHEGIHTVLDSTDALISRVMPPGTRWVTDPDLYDGESRTISPWTGRPLDVPTYVHGFFVWYGLLCFWSRVWLSNSFDAHLTRQRIIRAGAPFINEVALKPLAPFNDAIRSDILQTLNSIQTEVGTQFRSGMGEKEVP